MKLLLVSATVQEIQPLLTALGLREGNNRRGNLDLDVVVTGVGMVATAFSLAAAITKQKYDLALNLGIAGSFDRDLTLGSLVQVTKDTFSELGAEDGEKFITIGELGFGKATYFPIPPPFPLPLDLHNVEAITVNTVHGHADSIHKITARLRPQVETMEGAAFFYSCEQVVLPSVQIRAISNYVEPRNKESWEIGIAIKNLTSFAAEFITALVHTNSN